MCIYSAKKWRQSGPCTLHKSTLYRSTSLTQYDHPLTPYAHYGSRQFSLLLVEGVCDQVATDFNDISYQDKRDQVLRTG